MMFSLKLTAFFKETALVYYIDGTFKISVEAVEALEMIEDHFEDDRNKRVNDNGWSEATFNYIKLSQPSINEEVTHEHILNELCAQILKLTDIGASLCIFSELISKIIATVRGVNAFVRVYINPRK